MATHSAINLQIHPPTGITHCTSAYLTHLNNAHLNDPSSPSNFPNLIVIRSTILEVYQPTRLPGPTNSIKLHFIARQYLYGVVESVAVLQGHANLPDAILLAFRDAKLSVQQWDSASGDLTTTSLHYFEGDESLKAGRESFPRPPVIAADPSGRCAAMVMFRHQLAILPATESEATSLGVEVQEGEDLKAAAVGNSYVDNLSKVGIRDVRDIVFLHGTSEPTLLVLHEHDPTWAGNLRLKKDTCAISALSINLSSKRSPKIWSVDGLPFDAYKLAAVPTGGALVFFSSGILHYTPGHHCGTILHSSGVPSKSPAPPLTFDLTREQPGVTAAKYAKDHATDLDPRAASSVVSFCDCTLSHWNLEMDGARMAWISPSAALVGCRNGELLCVEVQKKVGGERSIRVSRAGAGPQPSCMASVALMAHSMAALPSTSVSAAAASSGGGDSDSSLVMGYDERSVVFLGSVAGDSLLIGCSMKKHENSVLKRDGTTTPATDDSSEDVRKAKRQKRVLTSTDTDDAEIEKKDRGGVDALDDNSNNDDDDDDDDDGLISLYGHTSTTESYDGVHSCTLSVLDSFVGMGPLRSLAAPPPNSTPSPGGDPIASQHPVLVGCCGAEKSGALIVLRQAVVPDIVTQVHLNDVRGVWSIKGKSSEIASTSATGDVGYDSHVIISFATSTKVLSSANEGMHDASELVQCVVDAPTVGAGVVCDGDFVVQGVPHAVRVLSMEGQRGGSGRTRSYHNVQVEDMAVHLSTAVTGGSKDDTSVVQIISLDVVDPYLVVLLSTGTAHLFKAVRPSENASSLSSVLHPVQFSTASHEIESIAAANMQEETLLQCTACCLYRDSGSWLTHHLDNSSTTTTMATTAMYCVVVYEDTSCAIWALSHDVTTPAIQSNTPAWYCQSLADGLPLLQPLLGRHGFARSSLAAGPRDDGSTCIPAPRRAAMHKRSEQGMMDGLPLTITDIRMECFDGHTAMRPDLGALHAYPLCIAPLLVALTSEFALLVYKAFAHDDRSLVRFKKIDILGSIPPILPPCRHAASLHQKTKRIFRFDSLGEQIPHSGIFIAGVSPVWLAVARGTVFAHPFFSSSSFPLSESSTAPGTGSSVIGFAPFHNINCPHGFITALLPPHSTTSSSAAAPSLPSTPTGIQISSLPSRQRLDCPWPRQKISIKATPIRIAFYPEARLFALAVAKQSSYKAYLPEEQGGEPQASYSYALADAVSAAHATVLHHEIRLVQPGSWLPLWRHALLPGEEALSVEAVHLKDFTTGNTVPLLAVGTGFKAGEDYPCSGRALFFEIKRKSLSHLPTSGGGSWSAEMIYAREFKGPVTGVLAMEGHVLLSIGNRLETLTLSSSTVAVQGSTDDETHGANTLTTKTTYKMIRSAFYDGPLLVTSLCSVKSFALTSDVQHSVQFVRYREDARQLTLLSKDFGRASVRAAQFMIAGSSLSIVAGDAVGTLRTYAYAPADPSSWKGQKLLQWGAFHIGEGIGTMLRVKMPAVNEANDLGAAPSAVTRHGAVYGTDSGGLGTVLPLAVSNTLITVDSLKSVQRELVTSIAHAAGLNPTAFRRRHAKIPIGMNGAVPYGAKLSLCKQGVLDGDLLRRYCHAPRAVQESVAVKAGVKRKDVLDALSVILMSSRMF